MHRTILGLVPCSKAFQQIPAEMSAGLEQDTLQSDCKTWSCCDQEEPQGIQNERIHYYILFKTSRSSRWLHTLFYFILMTCNLLHIVAAVNFAFHDAQKKKKKQFKVITRDCFKWRINGLLQAAAESILYYSLRQCCIICWNYHHWLVAISHFNFILNDCKEGEKTDWDILYIGFLLRDVAEVLQKKQSKFPPWRIAE